MDYAVFKTGGKQYRVKPGDTLDVELLPNEVDTIAEFGEVLALSDGGEVTFGVPVIEGAKVTAQVLSHYLAKKVRVQDWGQRPGNEQRGYKEQPNAEDQRDSQSCGHYPSRNTLLHIGITVHRRHVGRELQGLDAKNHGFQKR